MQGRLQLAATLSATPSQRGLSALQMTQECTGLPSFAAHSLSSAVLHHFKVPPSATSATLAKSSSSRVALQAPQGLAEGLSGRQQEVALGVKTRRTEEDKSSKASRAAVGLDQGTMHQNRQHHDRQHHQGVTEPTTHRETLLLSQKKSLVSLDGCGRDSRLGNWFSCNSPLALLPKGPVRNDPCSYVCVVIIVRTW